PPIATLLHCQETGFQSLKSHAPSNLRDPSPGHRYSHRHAPVSSPIDDSGRGNLHIVLFGFKISASSLPLVLRYMSEIEKRMPFEYDAHDRPRFQHGMLTSSTTIKPILLLALGVTMFGVMDGLGKVLTSDYSLAQIVWGRYAFALPVVLSMRRPGAWPD